MKPTYEELEQKLAESQREFRAADATIENLQMQVEKLAAENARLKAAVTQQIELRAVIKKAGRPPHADFWVQSICEAEEKVKRALEETPATDAFLAEVRNEAGALAVELFAQTLGSPYSVRDEKCYEDGFTRAIEVVRDIQAPRFAYKIRQAGM